MQPGVFGLIGYAHAAATELLDDAVVRNGLADHWREILRLRDGQVNGGCGVAVSQEDCWRKIAIALIDRLTSAGEVKVETRWGDWV